MWFARIAVEARGAATHRIEWQPPHELLADLNDPEVARRRVAWVRERVEPELAKAEPRAATVLVGKSLGSHATVLAAERDLPAIWLTPLLRQPEVVAALRAATAPFLLVGGTADWAWDGELARGLTPHVCEIDRADHGFNRPGEPLAASAAVLGELGTAMEEFLDTVVWPEQPRP